MNDTLLETVSAAATVESEALQVLVVDDQSSVLRFLASAFAQSDCVTATASTAEQALRLVADHQFDLILSDIKMPGLNGLEFLRAVKRKQPGTRVALMTGAPSVVSAAFGLRYGAYDYLPKPFSVTDLKKLIERARADRRLGRGQVGLPAGLAEELERRQLGVETLLHIGDLALDGAEPGVFMDAVLGCTARSLRCDAAVMLLRDAGGELHVSQHGSASLAGEITKLVQGRFDELTHTCGGRAVALTGLGGRVTALMALVPGIGQAVGMLCLVRGASLISAFLPDETELLLGYGTQFGDLASAINPIGDLYKTQLRQLAIHLGVPREIVDKAPSGDLWAGQTDEQELGLTYAEVDRLLVLFVDRRWQPNQLVRAGFEQEFVERVLRMIRRNQYKRRLPVIAKLTHRTMDRDFRYPRDWGT